MCHQFPHYQKQVTILSLHDLKSQKKTIPYKLFHQLPLTYQENLEFQYKKKSIEKSNIRLSLPLFSSTNSNFNASQQKNYNYRSKINQRKINNKNNKVLSLSIPRKKNLDQTNPASKLNNKENNPLQNIIKKCDKLFKNVITYQKIRKLKKMQHKQFNKLLAKSKINLNIKNFCY